MRQILYIFLIFWTLAVFAEEIPPQENEIEAAINRDSVQKDEQIQEVAVVDKSSGSSSENPDMAVIADVGLGYFSNDKHFRQGGHAIDDNGFALQGLELVIAGNADNYFRYDMSFQFVGMHVEEAYITTLSLPFNLQSKIGYMAAVAGRENRKCVHSLNFVNYSLMHNRFMSAEHFSGLGSEASWLLPMPWYSLVIAQVFDIKESSHLRSSSFANVSYTKLGKKDGLEDFVYIGRVENFFDFSDNLSLYIGINSAFGQSEYTPDNRVSLYGADFLLKWRDISGANDAASFALSGEYFLRDTQIPEDFVRDHGGFIDATATFSRQWQGGIRGDYAAMLKGKSVNPEKMAEKEWRGSATIAYTPTHFSKIRVQYDLSKKDEWDKISHAVFLQLETVIGAPQAHNY